MNTDILNPADNGSGISKNQYPTGRKQGQPTGRPWGALSGCNKRGRTQIRSCKKTRVIKHEDRGKTLIKPQRTVLNVNYFLK